MINVLTDMVTPGTSENNVPIFKETDLPIKYSDWVDSGHAPDPQATALNPAGRFINAVSAMIQASRQLSGDDLPLANFLQDSWEDLTSLVPSATAEIIPLCQPCCPASYSPEFPVADKTKKEEIAETESAKERLKRDCLLYTSDAADE